MLAAGAQADLPGADADGVEEPATVVKEKKKSKKRAADAGGCQPQKLVLVGTPAAAAYCVREQVAFRSGCCSMQSKSWMPFLYQWALSQCT